MKDKLNIVGRCYVKNNNVGGEILSFILNIPIKAYLDEFIFILTIPDESQKFAPAYARLANKVRENNSFDEKELAEFVEVKSVCYLKESQNKRGDILVAAPNQHILVDFSKLVVIATIPSVDKTMAPCYFKKKTYQKNKSELIEKSIDNEISYSEIPENRVDAFIKDCLVGAL